MAMNLQFIWESSLIFIDSELIFVGYLLDKISTRKRSCLLIVATLSNIIVDFGQ